MTGPGEIQQEARPLTTPIFETKTNTRVGTWNVRTLFQGGRMDQVLKTMRDYRLDILGFSEMRMTGQGCLVIDGATVLFSGKQDHHTHGVGVILSNCEVQALVGWKPVNERIITARLYTRHAKVTIVQVYAPTEAPSEEDKDAFYSQHQAVLDEIPSYDIKMLIGDLNAKVDGDRRGLNATVGPHGSASSTNDNGERLLMLASTNGLSIGNTFFMHKQIHKMTWVSPGGGTRNELDNICINTRWRSSLLDVRAHRGADVGSDHFLVVGKIRLFRGLYVLLQRLKDEVDNILREEQAGFRKGRSCAEQIFTLRNIIEQCQELQTPLIINYIDFKKAFDSIHRESLWQILQLYGIPSKYVNIFRALYHNSTCRVKTTNRTTDDFDIVTGPQMKGSGSRWHIPPKIVDNNQAKILWDFQIQV
ncbi:craniofacial development protein 2-like [Entelurus aequoreus]|uniref:craniofacial development protein 2-like n=1 Tax=Entelurus aequoreus TaxID=161455 RepID=UPI002B1D2885|nr:craniofacial development protein 2-like [Entelurus aequoreus]